MRSLVLSDVHGNLEALEATLADAPPCDAILILGDLVGYGADPNAVIDRVRGLRRPAIVRGNHDKVASGVASVDTFNHLARRAIMWTSDRLTPDNRVWLASLPHGPVIVDDGVEICHGSPVDEDQYIFDDADARRALDATRRPLCLFGHTHVPAVFRLLGETVAMTPVTAGTVIELRKGSRYLVNCGAVGQPRDGDPRAAFGVVDHGAGTVTFSRVAYDVATAQAKMLAAGLPDALARRLSVGR